MIKCTMKFIYNNTGGGGGDNIGRIGNCHRYISSGTCLNGTDTGTVTNHHRNRCNNWFFFSVKKKKGYRYYVNL
jgi:hypothetical protein